MFHLNRHVHRTVDWWVEHNMYILTWFFLQVCLPGLHITLGVFYRLFSLLEEACHNLDVAATCQGMEILGGATECSYRTMTSRLVGVEKN